VLAGFPLSDQVAYFPHQRLVSVDGRLRRFVGRCRSPASVIFASRLLDVRFTLGDPRLEIGDTPLQRFARA
jgi:hypothetical protein